MRDPNKVSVSPSEMRLVVSRRECVLVSIYVNATTTINGPGCMGGDVMNKSFV